MKKTLFGLVVVIAIFAIYGTLGLVLKEWEIGNICPKILGVPACYLVFICFSVALIAHLVPKSKSNFVYFFFVGLVTLIATTGTIGELTGLTKCPRTAGGTPMCFISLGICLSLLASKIAFLKVKKKDN